MVHVVADTSDFDGKLESAGDLLVVVDFFAQWCGPCKMIAPKLEDLANQYTDKAVVLKVDVDECEELAIRYNISSMPTFVFIKNKQVVETFSGANNDKLASFFSKYTA
ncbi:thioredoxin-2 [Phlebotomus argentipes]|uniref:thioredoxin-2 n=1 Tax=Phlebotomus argentipes TaxID=94469 RepID=UPI0028931644|nr:thioredoxin-2 [Phlebotomus argentipes]XP_059616349.1 thioredoxin-2 [Phlebotomus argentipes]